MTNNWLDLQNAKVFLIEGSNAASNHSMSTRWIDKAREKGAIVIHVDPRFTRTSSMADIYARIRPGTDIAFLGAIINYILQNKLYDEAFIKTHTNALYLVNTDFGFDEGVFSGWQGDVRKYDNATWAYQLDGAKKPRKAASLDDPHCVLANMKRFYRRYSFHTASAISGVPAKQIKLIADTLVKNRPGTIMYALGMTQHTTGVQNIRSFAILQLLLGNMGKPGSGINALRGEPNVQGATDMALLYNYLPGYVAYPITTEQTIEDYAKGHGTFRAKWLINGLKAWFGENATPENEFGLGWVPKATPGKPYSIFTMVDNALAGNMKLLYVVGQNVMITNPNLNLVHQALSNLGMLVVQDLWRTETACFWERPGSDPKSIKTEVLLLPVAHFMEKEGSITASGRMVQWRYKAVEPPGQAKGDLEVLDQIFRRVRDLYKDSNAPKDEILKKATWGYSGPDGQVQAEAVLQEINGRNWKTGELVAGIGQLQADGSTSSGNWIYAGVFGGGKNLSKRRDNKTDPSGLGIYPGFAWCWPGNMHILYNRASCDAKGQPFDPAHKLVWWDEKDKKWAGFDTPDVLVPTDGPETPNGQKPFRMLGEGVGRLMATPYKDPDPKEKDLIRDASYVPGDGPLPEFYEPVESPTKNALHPGVQNNPILKYPRLKSGQPIGTSAEFPYVLMTSSIAEHWCAGSVTRNVPWLNELVPEPMVALPKNLAERLGISTGDRVKLSSARGEATIKALVTRRMDSLNINGQEVFVVWVPYNWGFKGLSQGASGNILTIDAGDPNTGCQETKACLVNLKRVEPSRA